MYLNVQITVALLLPITASEPGLSAAPKTQPPTLQDNIVIIEIKDFYFISKQFPFIPA